MTPSNYALLVLFFADSSPWTQAATSVDIHHSADDFPPQLPPTVWLPWTSVHKWGCSWQYHRYSSSSSHRCRRQWLPTCSQHRHPSSTPTGGKQCPKPSANSQATWAQVLSAPVRIKFLLKVSSELLLASDSFLRLIHFNHDAKPTHTYFYDISRGPERWCVLRMIKLTCENQI